MTNPDPDVVRRLYRVRAEIDETLGEYERAKVSNALLDADEILAYALDDYTFAKADSDVVTHIIKMVESEPRVLCTQEEADRGVYQRPDADLCHGCVHAFVMCMFPASSRLS